MNNRPSANLYGESLALLTDLYELTMANAYWKMGMAEREAVFHLFFRRKPFKGEYAIAAGLEPFLDYVQRLRFNSSDLEFLETVRNGRGELIFERPFLDYLEKFSFSCDIDAMPEGTLVFPYEPIIRVTGPILQAQLLESILLNIVNFQTLIATKASRVCWAARPDPVVEFGLRRAQGIDGAISASRAAYIGGCHSTSNVLAGKFYGVPLKGTHAHSWIMAFDEELESFYAYSETMPGNCIFLIDTYNTISGVKNAIKAGLELRKKGVEMIGVRLDSGDLSHLSIEVRKLLDNAGFPDAKIMASNELDEYLIRDLKQQGAKINIWGVGTNLVTGKDQPALDGVYKLSALRDIKGKWQYKVKISEQWAKITNPGLLQVRRYKDNNGYFSDMIYDEFLQKIPSEFVDPFDPTKVKQVSPDWSYFDLLVPYVRKGKLVRELPSLHEIRERTLKELEKLPDPMRRFLNPQPYFVGLEKSLYELKIKLIKDIQTRSF